MVEQVDVSWIGQSPTSGGSDPGLELLLPGNVWICWIWVSDFARNWRCIFPQANQRQEFVQERGCILLDPYQQGESRTNLQRELLAPPAPILGGPPKSPRASFLGKVCQDLTNSSPSEGGSGGHSWSQEALLMCLKKDYLTPVAPIAM